MKQLTALRLAGALVFACLLGSPIQLPGAAIWRTNVSGLWSDGANWSSSPRAPSLATGRVDITNATTKTVTVDALTPGTNLFISALNVWAPPDSTNTLLLQDLNPLSPLVVSNQSLTVAARGLILVTNSSLVVTGRFINFTVIAGDVRLESGSIIAREEPLTPNVSVYTHVGRSNVATLTINGGAMETTDLYVGENLGQQVTRAEGRIHLNGGLLTVNGEFSLGKAAGCTGRVEMIGGQLTIPNNLTNILRIGDMGTGLLTISNSVANVGNVSVGRHELSIGSLLLQAGGQLNGSDDFSIGRFNSSTGRVTLDGGQLGIGNHVLWVGREGDGELTISNGLLSAEGLYVAGVATNLSRGFMSIQGGATHIASAFLVGATSIATGEVAMAGGVLDVTNQTRTAVLQIHGGSFTLDGGITRADTISILDPRAAFVFKQGRLETGGTSVTNGQPFVVGDGVHPATLHLAGGTHQFANGLIISANATLSGCGTVVGGLTVIGTDARDCNVTPTLPEITLQPASFIVAQGQAVQFRVEATGPGPLRYQWRFGVPGLGGGNLLNETNSTLSIPGAQPANTGNYRVIVSNDSGSVTSVVATLRVLVPPPLGNLTVGGGIFSVSFPSVTGLVYSLEYSDNLDTPAWTFVKSVVGTGALLSLDGPTDGQPTRFYRVRTD